MAASAFVQAHVGGGTVEFGGSTRKVGSAGRSAGRPDQPEKGVLVERARRLVAERRARHGPFPSPLFHEPGWDMMLALYLADADGRATIVKTLVGLAGAPATTAQRWIEALDRMGLVTRVTDPFDRRRIEVSLSAKGQEAMESYLAGL